MDRRYLTRDEASLMMGNMHNGLSGLRGRLRDQRSALSGLQARSSEHFASLDQQLADIIERLREAHTAAAVGAAFVAQEDPHALRKKLFDAHRLAGETAQAIEGLLQAELLLWQAIDASEASGSDSELADG